MKPTQSVTTQSIAAQRAAVEQTLKSLAEQEAQIKAAQVTKTTALLNSLPSQLSSILERPIDLSGAFAMLKAHIAGKLNLGPGTQIATQTTKGTTNRAYRAPLSSDELAKLKATLVARQAIIDAGQQPDKALSQISRDFKTSDATVNKYKAKWGLTRGSRVAA